MTHIEQATSESHRAFFYKLISTFMCRMNSALAPPVDPIEWFGALVSPNLRKSQEDFVAGKASTTSSC